MALSLGTLLAPYAASCLIITAKDSHTGGTDENPRELDPNDLERR